MHLKKQAQIEVLIFNKVLTSVLAQYSNYSNIFLAKYVAEYPEHTGINDHAMELKEGKQPFFGLTYSLGPIKLITLKTYIKTNMANGFI